MKNLWMLSILMGGCASNEPDRAALKAELKREILAEIREAPADDQAPPVSTGDVEGRLIFREKGVAGCHLKLVRLLEADTIFGLLQEVRLGTEFQVASDQDGRYAFRAVPVGKYRLFWQVPGDAGWIRRLRDKPDAVVAAGALTRIADVDLGRRPVASDSP